MSDREGDTVDVPDELWEEVCAESRATLDQQVRRIENYDTKAVGLFRANILLTGVLISGLAIIVRTNGVVPGQFLNGWSLFGALTLLLSTASSAMAYTSSSYDLGIGPEVIHDADRGIYESKAAFQNELRDLYKGWLEHNANVGTFNSYLITGTIILLIDSIIFFAGAVVTGLYTLPLLIDATLLLGAAVLMLILNAFVYSAEKVFVRIFPDDE